MKTVLFFLFFLIAGCFILQATTYIVDPTNYLTERDKLEQDDTLLLTPGNYTNGLRLNNKNGSADKWIVIKSEVPYQAILLGRADNNTMDITDCSYIKIEGLKFDGQNLEVDAIKASGSTSNWAHHIWINDNIITGHDAGQQIVGINTKITCWDWTISYNKIMSAGTGIYLGNSDGTMPFIRGIIEYNFVLNPVGYCMQIKHQNDRPDLPGIPTMQSSTIVRHNVFAKNERVSPDGDRPNVLFGGQPLNGTGSDDRVECYGNFFYNNPREFLLQATGNVSVHNNIFVNSSSNGAMTFQRHNNRSPKEVFVYNNSVYNVKYGVSITSPILTEKQIILANAIFADTPISAQSSGDNRTGGIAQAGTFFNNPSSVIGEMDFYPKSEFPVQNVDFTLFMQKDTDWDKDFNGNLQDGSNYGAYSGYGKNPGWKLALDIKGSGINSVDDNTKIYSDIIVYPNPVQDEFSISGIMTHEIVEILVTDILGNEVLKLDNYDSNKKINVANLYKGMYILSVGCKGERRETKIIGIMK